MLQPVRTKYRKAFKGRIHGKASRAISLNYGQYGLKALQPDRVIGSKSSPNKIHEKNWKSLDKNFPEYTGLQKTNRSPYG